MAFDLDGDGIETTGSVVTILFDHDADGVKTGTGWLKGDDGWLVMNRNGNGVIDSGRELFGVDTVKSNGQLAKDGFDALKDADSNKDGKISSTDSVFAKLRIWRDLNQDGVSQANELTTLAANQIATIGVGSTAVVSDLGNGNVLSAVGSFTRSNGTQGTTGETSGAAANLDLLVNTFYRQFTTEVTLTDQAKTLPDLHGSGRVRDLRQAISLSVDLGNWVKAYIQQTTRQGQVDRLDAFIDKWANTSDLKPLKAQADALAASGVKLTYQLEGMTAGTTTYDNFVRKLGIVERFMGFTYGEPTGAARFTPLDESSGAITVTLVAEQIANISLAYDRFKNDIYESLVLQTRLSSYVEKLDITLQDGKVVLSVQALETAFKQAIATKPRDGLIDLVEFISAVGETRLKSLNWNASEFLFKQLNTVTADLGAYREELSNWTVRFVSTTEGGVNVATSHEGVLVGNLGADILRSGNGDDIIFGKGGNDIIESGAGVDLLNGGDGNDTIDAGDGNDQVLGGLGTDTIYGGYGDDTIDGGDGNDLINDTSGSNVIKGGLGNDNITGTGTIEGGKGDDTIVANNYFSGETYVFNLGDGKDSIADYGYNSGMGYDTVYDDTLKFGTGILATAVTLNRSGNDMIFKVNATDQVSIKGWFADDFQYIAKEFQYIEKVQFADGTIWDLAKLKTIAPTAYNGSTAADTISGWNGVDKINGLAGNDTINGYGGNDVLDGGDGNDTIDAGDGNDQVLGGLGTDTIYGGYGDDTIDGGDGNDLINDTSGSNVIKGGLGNDSITGTGTIEGGKGDDTIVANNYFSGETYVFNLGDGKDSITDCGYNSGMGYDKVYDDTLRFGTGINANQLWFRKIGNDLDVTRIGSSEGVLIKNWYDDALYRIEQFKSADGKTLLHSQVDALVSAMAAFAPPPSGQTTLPTAYQTTLSSVIAANWK